MATRVNRRVHALWTDFKQGHDPSVGRNRYRRAWLGHRAVALGGELRVAARRRKITCIALAVPVGLAVTAWRCRWCAKMRAPRLHSHSTPAGPHLTVGGCGRFRAKRAALRSTHGRDTRFRPRPSSSQPPIAADRATPTPRGQRPAVGRVELLERQRLQLVGTPLGREATTR
jgi:hypothetical protein